MRLNAVQELKNQFMYRQELRECLHGLFDLERLTGKVALQTANARDLVALSHTLEKLPAIRQTLAGCQDEWLRTLTREMDPLPDLCDLLAKLP